VTDPLDLLRAALEGRYAVERLIGQGGMATVYLARDSRHDRPVAVKVLRAELAASIGADRFLREIKVAAQLQHPNILALYDSGEASGYLYYVMPFVKGESLRVRLDREEQLSLPDAIGLTCEIAEALHYAHTQHVIHRDIKPENILLHEDHALVADFGIARAVTHAEGDKLTETGMAVGTPHYMSPEQAHGGDRVDGRADQYSLACMLYEMLVGQPPFHGPNAMAILARHSMEVVPSLQVVRNSIPDEVEDAIMRALEKTPADRFPTIREFSDALASVDLGPSARRTSSRSMRARRTGPQGVRRTTGAVAASPASFPARVLSFARSRGIGFWSAAAVVLLAAGGLGAWRVWLRPDASAGTPGLSANRIAVMYFRNRTGQDSLNFLADGLTEALIHELSQVKPLQVVSSNGVSAFKNAAAPPDSIARALKVGTIVQGGVAQSGDRLRVTVSLINAGTGAEIGNKTLERPRQEIFELQDQLAQEVSIFLRERLGQEIQLQQTRAETKDPAAWELVQQAAQLTKDLATLLAAGDTAAGARQLTKADSLLARASTIDPKWPTPIVTRGWVAYQRRTLAPSPDKAYLGGLIQQGLGYAEQAIKLKPKDADALDLRGTLRYSQWYLNLEPDSSGAARLLADAERDLRDAVALNPSQAHSWAVLSHLLMRRSESAEGKLAALRAYEADPYLTEAPVILYRLFTSSLDLQDGVEANHWCQEGRRRFPAEARFLECQLLVFSLPGQKPDIEKAWQLLDEYVKIYPPNQREFQRREGQLFVAMALVRAGLPDSARAVALRSRADATIDPGRELVYFEAMLRNLLGDRDEALRLVGIYLATNAQDRATLAKDDTWWWQGLRDDPRFKALVGISN
jgi:TolB-like protein/tRNA A-37 threonylcarbamoyl transferase component Bud32